MLFFILLTYSKTCVNSHSKIDKTNVLKPYGSLMKVESIAECNTFDLHEAIISLKPRFLCFSEWPFYTGFTVFAYNVAGDVGEAVPQ